MCSLGGAKLGNALGWCSAGQSSRYPSAFGSRHRGQRRLFRLSADHHRGSTFHSIRKRKVIFMSVLYTTLSVLGFLNIVVHACASPTVSGRNAGTFSPTAAECTALGTVKVLNKTGDLFGDARAACMLSSSGFRFFSGVFFALCACKLLGARETRQPVPLPIPANRAATTARRVCNCTMAQVLAVAVR